jgi:hypothetical protein
VNNRREMRLLVVSQPADRNERDESCMKKSRRVFRGSPIPVGRLALFVFLLTAAAAPAMGQGWTWEATLFTIAGAISGEQTVLGIETELDASFSDIVENLELGAMGRVRAASNRWTFGLELMYVGLGADIDRPAANVDIDQWTVESSLGYRISQSFELFGGARYNSLEVGVRFRGPLGLQESGTQDWWDPFVGGRLTLPLHPKWRLLVKGDLGGFGIGADFAWGFEPLLEWQISRSASLLLGYRWIDVDYVDEDAGFGYDMLTQGPELGVTFRF